MEIFHDGRGRVTGNKWECYPLGVEWK